MKKFLSLIILFLLCFSLCACNEEETLMLTFKKGEEIIGEMTADDFISKSKSTNIDKNDFDISKFVGCTVSGKGTITNISNMSSVYGENNEAVNYYDIIIDDKIILRVNSKSYIDCKINDEIKYEYDYSGILNKNDTDYLFLHNNKKVNVKYSCYEILK